MKIAYLLGSLNRGGAETLLLDVFRNATKNNLNAIGIYRKTGALESDFLHCGIAMHKLTPEYNKISYLRRLRKLLSENHIDIVHAQQPIDAMYAYLACLFTNTCIVLTLHGYDFDPSKFSDYILRFILRRTACNIYVSNKQLQYYQKKFDLKHDKQKVVYNGISFDKFSPTRSAILNQFQDKNTLRNELHLLQNSLLIGTVGNFNEVRDQLTLCRFALELKKAAIDFHFIFVGRRLESMPHLYDDCVNYCKQNGLEDKVLFLGSRTDIPRILDQLDAFVYATDHDTFGIAVVEAMAVGVPVFVNDWEVMKEITVDGKYATLYKTKDEKDLLREFMLFLQNKQVCQSKAIEAAKFVKETYSIEKHIDTLQEVYNQILING
ncbi:MAG: glycosyltransferase family 4 protein [Paludibacter sp.]